MRSIREQPRPTTDPATWTTHYGVVEPGSMQEYDPTCPMHGELRERCERAEADRDALRERQEAADLVAIKWKRHALAAEAERDALRTRIDRVERLFSLDPDTPCTTVWRPEYGIEGEPPEQVECVVVPIEELRRALDGEP